MGFKDLEAFNQALVGKQVWRILTKPNLLVSKVLKAKYFPKESILNCKTPQDASRIWQGLMGERSLIDKDLIRRIGNGRSTSVWDHKWIPRSSTGKPTSSRPINCELKMVNELICHKRWNKNIIFRTFNRDDAERILSIPISLIGREDSYFWQPQAGGTDTVSSGYNILMEENSSVRKCKTDEAGTSYTDESQQVKQM